MFHLTKKDVVSALVITVFFTFEALIHYSIGKTNETEGFKIYLPSLMDAVKIVLVVMLFAGMSTMTTAGLEKYMK